MKSPEAPDKLLSGIQLSSHSQRASMAELIEVGHEAGEARSGEQ